MHLVFTGIFSVSFSSSNNKKKSENNAIRMQICCKHRHHILIEQRTGEMKMNLDACKTFSFIRNSKFIHNLLCVCVCIRIFSYTRRTIATEMSMICHMATLSVFNATILYSIQYALSPTLAHMRATVVSLSHQCLHCTYICLDNIKLWQTNDKIKISRV